MSASAGDENASASSAKVSDTRAHQRIIRDFVRAIETGGTPICDGREGRRSVALIEAIYESAKTHQPVELPIDVAPAAPDLEVGPRPDRQRASEARSSGRAVFAKIRSRSFESPELLISSDQVLGKA